MVADTHHHSITRSHTITATETTAAVVVSADTITTTAITTTTVVASVHNHHHQWTRQVVIGDEELALSRQEDKQDDRSRQSEKNRLGVMLLILQVIAHLCGFNCSRFVATIFVSGHRNTIFTFSPKYGKVCLSQFDSWKIVYLSLWQACWLQWEHEKHYVDQHTKHYPWRSTANQNFVPRWIKVWKGQN